MKNERLHIIKKSILDGLADGNEHSINEFRGWCSKNGHPISNSDDDRVFQTLLARWKKKGLLQSTHKGFYTLNRENESYSNELNCLENRQREDSSVAQEIVLKILSDGKTHDREELLLGTNHALNKELSSTLFAYYLHHMLETHKITRVMRGKYKKWDNDDVGNGDSAKAILVKKTILGVLSDKKNYSYIELYQRILSILNQKVSNDTYRYCLQVLKKKNKIVTSGRGLYQIAPIPNKTVQKEETILCPNKLEKSLTIIGLWAENLAPGNPLWNEVSNEYENCKDSVSAARRLLRLANAVLFEDCQDDIDLLNERLDIVYSQDNCPELVQAIISVEDAFERNDNTRIKKNIIALCNYISEIFFGVWEGAEEPFSARGKKLSDSEKSDCINSVHKSERLITNYQSCHDESLDFVYFSDTEPEKAGSATIYEQETSASTEEIKKFVSVP